LKEKVLVVDVDRLGELVTRDGLLALPLEYIKKTVELYGCFVPREEAERDESGRQIIPYVILRNEKRYLLMRRTNRQGESRLHDKYSIGVGGHINPEDGRNPWQAFERGMRREIDEEVNVDISSLEYLGILNDLSTAVSRVHIGIVYIASVAFHGFNEKDKFTGSMVEFEELEMHREKMETWSQIVMNWLK
jgi:predicted NUDIX family phosphoesterase